ncbi:hypothetical protein V6N13_149693 [Hibiscus sabdariffa]
MRERRKILLKITALFAKMGACSGNCLKCFHPQCVEEDDSLLESSYRWFCGWHSCINCDKAAKFHCSCCPSAVCGRCLCDTEFAVFKGTKGLCNICLQLALLIEDKKDVDSNGVQVKVDFNDRATSEFLFKCYWELVKEKEGLTSQQLHSSDRLLKNGKNYDIQANYNCREEDIMDFEGDSISESDDWRDDRVRCRKRKRGKPSPTKRKGKLKKRREYVGWASKQLVEFLTSVGKDVTHELSQYDVVTVVTEYCNKHKLFHPKKRKKVICDERLQSLLGRKSVNKNGIYKLLTLHFSENLEKSEDSVGFSLEEDDNVSVPCKRQRKPSPDWKFEEKEIATNPRQGHLAAIVSTNIKLVYLKRSLVLELAKQLDTFNDKIVGSFVRIKSDPSGYFQKNSHMLVQVKGIKETSMKEETTSTILLQVSYRLKEIRVCELSDDNFTEEEIGDLSRQMGTRVLERPTVTPSEQSRLLHEVPEVVAEAAEPEPALKDSLREYIEEHKALSESAPRSISRIQKCISENDVVSSVRNEGMDAAVIPEGKQHDVKKASTSTGVEDDETVRDQNSQEVNRSCTVTSVPQLQAPQEESADSQTGSVCLEKQHKRGAAETLPRPVDLGEQLNLENHQCEVVELSDVEIQDARTSVSPLFPREESADSQTKTSHKLKQSKHDDAASAGGKLTRPADVGVHVKVENHEVEVIDLSDDEIDNARTSVPLLLPREDSADSKTKTSHQLKQSKYGDAASAGGKLTRPVDVGVHVKLENHQVEVIDLSNDEIDDARTSVPSLLPREESADSQTKTSQQLKQSKHGDAASAGEKLTRPVNPGVHVKVENHEDEVIDLSEDEIDDAANAMSHQTSTDHDCPIWYCISPQGNTKGPYSMRVLKQWSASSITHCELHFKVYKSGQKPEEALLLVDAFRKTSGIK